MNGNSIFTRDRKIMLNGDLQVTRRQLENGSLGRFALTMRCHEITDNVQYTQKNVCLNQTTKFV